MSRRPVARGGPVPGHVALPLPPGDPDVVATSVARLRRACDAAGATATVRGVAGPMLMQVWAGPAATAAVAEAGDLARRAQVVVRNAGAAGAELDRYAAALSRAREVTLGLQREWDMARADHDRMVWRARAGAVMEAEVTPLLLRLEHEHESHKGALSRSYATVLDELRAAAVLTARRLDALSTSTAPHGFSVESVTGHLTVGLPFAEGATRAVAARTLALTDAATVRRVLRLGSTAEAVQAVLRTLVSRADDPLYAQALVDELGVDGIHRLVTQLTTDTAWTQLSTETTDLLVGVLGRVVLTAASPSSWSTGHLDPRTAAQVAGSSALISDELVASVGQRYLDGTTDTRHEGYWLVAQMIAGARRSGHLGTLRPELVRRLVAATAAAEVAESRDSDWRATHGTTLGAHGDDRFTSLLSGGGEGGEGGEATGDALHVLLSEVGTDPADALAVLSTSIYEGGLPAGTTLLTNARGEPVTVAEYLTRRWITYENAGTATHLDLQLATNGDLLRLLGEASSADARGWAEVKARVLNAVAELSQHTQVSPASAAQYEHNTALVEARSVEWLASMRASIDAALFGQPTSGAEPAAYVLDVDGEWQSLLTVEELARLVSAYCVEGDTARAGREPAGNYQRMVAAEVDHARQQALAGADVDGDVRRVGFLDAAASVALGGAARRQDELNRQAWEMTVEAKNYLASGSKSLLKQGGKVLSDQAGRFFDELDKSEHYDALLVEALRSDKVGEQAAANENRTVALAHSLAAARGTRPEWSESIEDLMRVGAGEAPHVVTVGEAAMARLDAFNRALDEANLGKLSTLLELPTGLGGIVEDFSDAMHHDADVPSDRHESSSSPSTVRPEVDVSALSRQISLQRQERHVRDHRSYGGGSYFLSAGDAQRVLGAIHAGQAEVLGLKGKDIVVRVTTVTGFNHNPGAGFVDQPTHVFFVKGSTAPSVVPYNPRWQP